MLMFRTNVSPYGLPLSSTANHQADTSPFSSSPFVPHVPLAELESTRSLCVCIDDEVMDDASLQAFKIPVVGAYFQIKTTKVSNSSERRTAVLTRIGCALPMLGGQSRASASMRPLTSPHSSRGSFLRAGLYAPPKMIDAI
jgi:hypothetical protein